MTQIIYTALRELTGVTVFGFETTIEVGITECQRSRAVTKDVVIAKGGPRETLYHRADILHAITFQPVNGFLKKQFIEFLASTESGEEFAIYLYGDEALPITVKRSDDGHSENAYMYVGTPDKDYIQSSITVVEV